MDDNAMEFMEEGCAYLLGIASNSVQRYINIAIDACTRGIIKSNNVGIVVVLEELTIDCEDFLVVAEDIVEFAYRETVLSSYGFDPLLDFV